MLALVTYKFIYHCYGKSVLYRIRRGLLFYYCWMGVCRYLKVDNRQRARVFYAPSASLLPSASADGLKDLEAKPLPLWVFNPFHRLHLKGLKTTEEPATPGTITYPSAEADGKREAAA